jgi:hypothetical protein
MTPMIFQVTEDTPVQQVADMMIKKPNPSGICNAGRKSGRYHFNSGYA